MTDELSLRDLREQMLNAQEVPGDDREDGHRSDRDMDAAGPGAGSDPGCAEGMPGQGGNRYRDGGRARGQIFDGCPITPLGVYGEVSFYLDRLGQLRGVDNHSREKVKHVFGGETRLLAMHFPQFTKEGDIRPGKWDHDNASTTMIQATCECGVWSPTGRVRGPGCWTDETGNLIVHAGDAVLVDGEWQPPGVYHNKVYSASDPVPRPIPRTTRSNPAEDVLSLVETWNWRRPDLDPQLILGVICAQMLGGALEWRPVAWLTGDAATGKSTFQKLLLYVHGGETGLLQAADATEAGIRSVVGFSSLPVAIDELEPDADRPQKVRAVVELARRASSGAQIFRGSADQKGYQSNAYSCFLFSSILVPPMPPQDRSRLILLDLDKIDTASAKLHLDPRKLRTVGQALRQRIVQNWDTWPERLEMWRAALALEGHSGRGADNFGTVLALADMAMSDDLPTPDHLAGWARKIGRAIAEDSVEVGSNADDMVLHLLGQRLDPFRRGEQYTVAQWIMAASGLSGAPPDLLNRTGDKIEENREMKKANTVLASFGLKVDGRREDARIFMPSAAIPALCDLFDGSQWAGGTWYQAAQRLPGAERVSSPRRLAGLSTRGCYVPISSIPGLSDFQTDTPVTIQTPSDPRGEPSAEDFL